MSATRRFRWKVPGRTSKGKNGCSNWTGEKKDKTRRGEEEEGPREKEHHNKVGYDLMWGTTSNGKKGGVQEGKTNLK